MYITGYNKRDFHTFPFVHFKSKRMSVLILSIFSTVSGATNEPSYITSSAIQFYNLTSHELSEQNSWSIFQQFAVQFESKFKMRFDVYRGGNKKRHTWQF